MNTNPSENDDEILDLVDDGNRVIGTVRRAEVHGNPALQHRAVHLFVKDKQGRFYLQKRSLLKRVQPGKWDTSVGGHLAAGQTYEEGALRELAEELGVELKDASALSFSHEYAWRSPFETEHIRTYVLTYEGPFTLQKDEVEDGKFWAVEELKQAVGQGLLTPNLEHELRLLNII